MATITGSPASWVDVSVPAAELLVEALDAAAGIDFPIEDCAEAYPAEWIGTKALRAIPATVLAQALDGSVVDSASFRITRIRAIAANRVLVEFTGDPGPLNPADPASPLKPENWELVPLDASGTRFRYAQQVRLLTEETWLTSGIVQLLGSSPPAFVLDFDGVLTQAGSYRLIALASPAATGFDRGDFGALVIHATAHELDARTAPAGILDLANPVVRRDTIRVPPALGTYQLDETGDFAVDRDPAASLRKRIVRRVLSAAGSFFHLRGYGVGVYEKRLITRELVRDLEAKVAAQVREEPDVRAAQVSVFRRTSAPNVVWISVRARTNGGDVEAVVPVSLP